MYSFRPALRPLLSSLLVVSGLGCSSAEPVMMPNPTPKNPTTQTPANDAPVAKLAWGTCVLPNGKDSIEAECAFADMPVLRSDPARGTTPIAVYRLRAAQQPATAQMWMLNGGPGFSGGGMAGSGVAVMDKLSQSVDVYLVDHRGTGESTAFACANAASATTPAAYGAKCSAELRTKFGDDKVNGFSTTESATDVRDLMQAVRAEVTQGQKVFLYGGSYGSYWAHRVLQLPDVTLDGVITDGNCISSTCSFDRPQQFYVDEVMKFMTDACKTDTECHARLGDDPWKFAKDTLDAVAQGHCSVATFSQRTGAALLSELGIWWVQGVMPTLYRLSRCSPADVAVLNTFDKKLGEYAQGLHSVRAPLLGTPTPDDANFFSAALQLHIMASELVSRPVPSPATLQTAASSLVFQPDASNFDLGAFSSWKGYEHDSFVGGWAKRDVPWLMLQGTFDFQTAYSLSQEALKHVEDPSLQFVRIDGGGHGVAFVSTCSAEMIDAFMKDPQAKLDTSCVSELKSQGLAIDARYAKYFMGTTNAWD